MSKDVSNMNKILMIRFGIISVGVLLSLALLNISCNKLELVRVMDTSTDSILISGSTVVVYGTALDLGSGGVVAHGHCWATHQEPTVGDNYSDNGPVYWENPFYSTLQSIRPGVKHYVRSYMFDGGKYTYGDLMSFEITADNIQFNSENISKIDPLTIQISSSTTGIGSIKFSDHGHCWSQTDPPTINDSATSLGEYNADASFTSEISNLSRGRYYIRGYLENEGVVVYTNTTIYSSEITIQTRTISFNEDNHVVAQGNIISLGTMPIQQHGHCWSATSSRPDYNSTKSSLGPVFEPAQFNTIIPGLESGTTYYIRAYATDGSFVYYGEIKSFVAN